MRCPYCRHMEDKVIDSRIVVDGTSIRRRRECVQCAKRFTTYEVIEESPIMVIKKNAAREPFLRKKIQDGITRACEKRPVSLEQIENIVDNIQEALEKMQSREIETSYIGELVMNHLQKLDEVAYVRFASVYRQFKDVSQFLEEVSHILKK